MRTNPYLIPGVLLLAGILGFALFTGPLAERIDQLLSAVGTAGLLWVYANRRKTK